MCSSERTGRPDPVRRRRQRLVRRPLSVDDEESHAYRIVMTARPEGETEIPSCPWRCVRRRREGSSSGSGSPRLPALAPGGRGCGVEAAAIAGRLVAGVISFGLLSPEAWTAFDATRRAAARDAGSPIRTATRRSTATISAGSNPRTATWSYRRWWTSRSRRHPCRAAPTHLGDGGGGITEIVIRPVADPETEGSEPAALLS
jgi:hypothetical protein